MAYQEILSTDNLPAGRAKMKNNFEELYTLSVVSITEAVSLTSSALGKIHVCTGTTVNYTVDLPTAVGNEGVIIFKGAAALTKVVTIAGVSGQLIDGETDRKISTCGMIALMSDGANWVVTDEVGSWIPYTAVVGGFSSDPTFDRMEYFRVGKKCKVAVRSVANGVSNATTKTITLPFVAYAGSVQSSINVIVMNNGTFAAPGMFVTRVSSNTADVYRDVLGTAWTASGNCRISFDIEYHIA